MTIFTTQKTNTRRLVKKTMIRLIVLAKRMKTMRTTRRSIHLTKRTKTNMRKTTTKTNMKRMWWKR